MFFRLINQAGEPKKTHLPLLKEFENSSVTFDIDGARHSPIGLDRKHSLVFGSSRHNDQYSRHCAYSGSSTKERPFIKRLGSVALPADLDENEARNKRVKIELTTKPSFRAPTLTNSYHADRNNDQRVESENAKMEPLTMTAEVDCQKLLKETPQGQYFLIDKASSLCHFGCCTDSAETKWKNMAEFGIKNQGTGHFLQLKKAYC